MADQREPKPVDFQTLALVLLLLFAVAHFFLSAWTFGQLRRGELPVQVKCK